MKFKMAQESKDSKNQAGTKKAAKKVEPEKKTSAKKVASESKVASEKKTSTAAKKTASASKKPATVKKETASEKGATAKKGVAKKDSAAKKVTKKETENREAEVKKVETKKQSEVESKVEKSAKKAVVSSDVKDAKKDNKEKKWKDVNRTTFLKPAEVVKKWIILDAAGKPLGRVAALAASMLRGKHKVDFTPNVDCGDSVIIINCKDVVLTGKKLEQKVRYHHSGWIGGIKETKYSELMKKNPQKAMTMAVVGMLPHNSLGAKMAKHLRTYSDEKHGQEAQKPEKFEF